ncbi:hypothetical protein DIJ64_10810 [Mycobacterium leprae]|uniref:Uncharacterized protein n=1 Tax=Mycobacterium leprae TaxID=1769 RepID=A0AAD0KW87_MYCLR|nr:hypothetical protein DIJ64_10810 [Mycobacterium leprae]
MASSMILVHATSHQTAETHPWHSGDDGTSLFAGKTCGERITEQPILTCRLGCPIQRRPASCIGNVGSVPGV